MYTGILPSPIYSVLALTCTLETPPWTPPRVLNQGTNCFGARDTQLHHQVHSQRQPTLFRHCRGSSHKPKRITRNIVRVPPGSPLHLWIQNKSLRKLLRITSSILHMTTHSNQQTRPEVARRCHSRTESRADDGLDVVGVDLVVAHWQLGYKVTEHC